MAYKKIDNYFPFADIAIQKNADKNRSLLFLKKINDRISFKSFLDMPLDYSSPDHSTFSRFRKRLSRDAMVQINSVLLKQFYQQGISINKGVAVDARLVKSASKPISKKKIKILKEKKDTPEGSLDKTATLKSLPGILTLTGFSKMRNTIMVLKSMLLLIPIPDLFFLLL